MTVSIGRWNNNEKLLTIIFNHFRSHKRKSNVTVFLVSLTRPTQKTQSQAMISFIPVRMSFLFVFEIDSLLSSSSTAGFSYGTELELLIRQVFFLSFQQRGVPLFGTNSLPGPTSNPSASAHHLAFPRLFRSMANSRAVPFVTASILENRGE